MISEKKWKTPAVGNLSDFCSESRSVLVSQLAGNLNISKNSNVQSLEQLITALTESDIKKYNRKPYNQKKLQKNLT